MVCHPEWHQWTFMGAGKGAIGYMEYQICNICGQKKTLERWSSNGTAKPPKQGE